MKGKYGQKIKIIKIQGEKIMINETMNNVPTYMSINDAAKTSGMSAHYIRDLVKENKIKHVKSGMKYLINYPKMMDYFESLENNAA